jgi:hypothetical protein
MQMTYVANNQKLPRYLLSLIRTVKRVQSNTVQAKQTQEFYEANLSVIEKIVYKCNCFLQA